jgi:hypothetical protein
MNDLVPVEVSVPAVVPEVLDAEFEVKPEPEPADDPADDHEPRLPPELVEEWRDVQKAKAKYKAVKEQASALKKAWESKQEAFDQAFKDHINGQQGLFDPPKKAPAEDAWKKEPLGKVLAAAGLSEKVIEKLAEADLKTVGDLAAYVNADGGRQKLTDIKGVGPATAEKIEAALEQFWKDRDAAQAATEPDDGDDEDEEDDE